MGSGEETAGGFPFPVSSGGIAAPPLAGLVPGRERPPGRAGPGAGSGGSLSAAAGPPPPPALASEHRLGPLRDGETPQGQEVE